MKNKNRDNYFILGYYGWKNTGDDAMMYSLLSELKTLRPEATFTVLSHKPAFVPPCAIHSVEFVSEKQIFKLISNMAKSSSFILGGGTHLFDYGNQKNRIIRLTQLYLLISINKFFKKRIYFIGVGIEQPTKFYGRFLIKHICNLADLITVRDSISFEVLQKMNIAPKFLHTFDLAALLMDHLDHPKNTKAGAIKKLGVSILPFFEIYYNNVQKDNHLLKELAKGLNQWLDDDKKRSIYLFVFKGESLDHDVYIINALRKLIYERERVRIIPYCPNPLTTLERVAECDAFVGMRYHSCIFSYLASLPMIIISYAQKNESLIKDIGLDSKAVLSLELVLKGEFPSRLMRMNERPDEFVASLPINIAEERSKLKDIL